MLFVFGVLAMALGAIIIYVIFWLDFVSNDYLKKVFLVLLAVVFFILGIMHAAVSIIGSNERVRTWINNLYHGILGGRPK